MMESGIYHNKVDGQLFFFNKELAKFYKVNRIRRGHFWRFWEKWYEVTNEEAKLPKIIDGTIVLK